MHSIFLRNNNYAQYFKYKLPLFVVEIKVNKQDLSKKTPRNNFI